jgi:hypothetical protein
LGHVISKEGLEKTNERVEDIIKAPPPRNQAELKSFIGMVNYYGRFIKNLSTVMHTLYELMSQSVEWKWTPERQKTFEFIKQEIISDRI